jgi:hypothetical protein
MPTQILNTIGLVLNIVGVGLLFFYGPPQPSFEEGVAIGLGDATPLENGKTVAQHNEEVRKTKTKHSFLSRLALILIIIGFAFQLWATWAIY